MRVDPISRQNDFFDLNRGFFRGCFILVLSCIIGLNGWVSKASTDGERILKEHAHFMSEIETFSVRTEWIHETEIPGEDFGLTMELRMETAVRGPNEVRAESQVEITGFPELESIKIRLGLISDGERCFLLHSGSGGSFYQVIRAPRGYEQVFDPDVWKRSEDLFMVASRLLGPAVFQSKDELLEASEHLEYLGVREIAGRSVHGFELDCEKTHMVSGINCSELLGDVDAIRFYLFDGEQPLLAATEARVGSIPKPVLMVMEWDLEARLPDSHFRFDPPSGYRRVDSLVGGLPDIFD